MAGLGKLLGDVAQLLQLVVWLARPRPYKLRAPRLLTSTDDSMLAAPQSAARRAKWASVIPTPIHAKSKPKFTKAYSFGLLTGSSSIVMEPTIRLPNDQRVQRGRLAQGAFTWSDFFPAILSSAFENWPSKFPGGSPD